jgi:hypothetical protein
VARRAVRIEWNIKLRWSKSEVHWATLEIGMGVRSQLRARYGALVMGLRDQEQQLTVEYNKCRVLLQL